MVFSGFLEMGSEKLFAVTACFLFFKLFNITLLVKSEMKNFTFFALIKPDLPCVSVYFISSNSLYLFLLSIAKKTETSGLPSIGTNYLYVYCINGWKERNAT